MYEDIKEQVSVEAVFKNGKVIPRSFNWRGRDYLVTGINLEHQEKRGDDLWFCFSVTSRDNNYELTFNSKHLTWTLERAWNE